jgi:hypothetical protein
MPEAIPRIPTQRQIGANYCRCLAVFGIECTVTHYMARTIWPLPDHDRMYQKGYMALATKKINEPQEELEFREKFLLEPLVWRYEPPKGDLTELVPMISRTQTCLPHIGNYSTCKLAVLHGATIRSATQLVRRPRQRPTAALGPRAGWRQSRQER